MENEMSLKNDLWMGKIRTVLKLWEYMFEFFLYLYEVRFLLCM